MKQLLRIVCALQLLLIACLQPGCTDSSDSEALRFKGCGLLILSIDTLRADRLGCYGNPRGLTPTLDKLAKEGILFERVYANSPKTASSHMSLFTSMLPTAHGVTNFSPKLKIPLVTLANNRITLGQVLERAGYWNAAVASGANLRGGMGFRKGFTGKFSSRLRPVTSVVNEALVAAERSQQQEKPPFLFIHTYQVHAPYIPPPEYRKRFAPKPRGTVGDLVKKMAKLNFSQQWKDMHEGLWDHKDRFGTEDAAYLSDLYDGEVAYTDHVLGKLFDGLEEEGLLDRMIVVVLSDHGEEFFEHGDFEHDQLYGEHLHVPLIIRLPNGVMPGTRVKGMASLLDVMPTVLDLLEIPGPMDQMMGASLVPAIRSGKTTERPLIAERVMYADAYQAALRSSRANVIFRAREGTIQAYDLREDAEEMRDVAWDAPFFDAAAGALKRGLTSVFAQRLALDRIEAGKAAELEEEALEELRQLGYLQANMGDFELPEGSPLERWPNRAR